MTNTALGAKNTHTITFKNKEHEEFYLKYLSQCRYEDVYHKALVYCLGISPDTRNHVKEIYDFNGSIIFFVGLPPRNVLICYATLDRMEKQCCSFITDGEELKNNLLFLRQAT